MIRSKAEAYGVTMSELVLAAVRAYERTYGEDVAEGEAVAVNYAAWLRVEQDLARIEGVLRELAQQVVGTRRMLSMLADEGVVAYDDAAPLIQALRGCHAEASVARRSVTEALDRLDAACAARGIVDEGMRPSPRR